LPEDELLAHVLQVLDGIFDDLPDDQELATYYVLGACSRYANAIADIMQRTNIEVLTKTPEMADKLASEYALSLEEKYLRQKLKAPLSLLESRNLRQKLNELTKKIGLRLIT
ncbi:MAG: DNA primase, partial [Acinetobacter sp.]